MKIFTKFFKKNDVGGEDIKKTGIDVHEVRKETDHVPEAKEDAPKAMSRLMIFNKCGCLLGMVLGGVLSVVLAGWVMPRKAVFVELTNGGKLRRNVKLFPVVYFLLRYVAPVGILAMIVSLVL